MKKLYKNILISFQCWIMGKFASLLVIASLDPIKEFDKGQEKIFFLSQAEAQACGLRAFDCFGGMIIPPDSPAGFCHNTLF